MKQIIVDFLTNFHSRKSSKIYKIVSLVFGMLIFLVILPAIFIYMGFLIRDVIDIKLGRVIEIAVSVMGLIVGIFFLTWTTIFQWRIGKGVPAPNAPTRHLVTTGPYRFCRNPIEFGAIFYYLGIGTITGGIVVGIVCFLSGLIIGSAYHKFIEESELEVRFGDEYRQYKKEMPFLFPRFRRNKK